MVALASAGACADGLARHGLGHEGEQGNALHFLTQ